MNGSFICALFWGMTLVVPRPGAQENLAVSVPKIDRVRILRPANQALSLKLPAITGQVATNSASRIHDFYSQADHAWPNPTNQSGLPCIGRDGESNLCGGHYCGTGILDKQPTLKL